MMTIRWHLLIGTLWILTTSTVEAKAPNILFLFADDQAYDTFGPYDDPVVQTPNLDRLASQGATFTHCFNMGSWTGAVCVASRTMLNTGQTLWRAHAADGVMSAVKRGKKPFSAIPRPWSLRMKDLGYETYFSGKWHVKANPDQLFDHVRHVRPGMPRDTRLKPYNFEGYHRPVKGKPDKWSPYDRSFGGFWEGGQHWSEVLADDAVSFLRQAADSQKEGEGKPFFMYLAFNAPHDPRQSPKEFIERYPLDVINVPKPFQPKYPFKTDGLKPTLRDEMLAPYPRTRYAVKVNRQEYYALITHLDQQIGRILDELKTLGLDENTWIIFTADHGLACGHHGLMGKQNMHDHSLRPPFVIAGPTVKANAAVHEPIYLQDLMATALDLAGDGEREGIEFQSLLPLLEGKPSKYSSIYGAYTKGQRMVRVDGYKLILYPQLNVKLLYDLKSDPLELNNLAEDESQLPRMRTLFAQLQALQKQYGDDVSLAEAYPALARR